MSTTESGNREPGARHLRRGLLALAGAALLGSALIAVVAVTDPSATTEDETVDAVAQDYAVRYGNDPGAVYDRALVTPSPSPVPTPAPTPPPGPPLQSPSFQMVIDRIGVNAPVNPYGLDRNAVPQVPLNAYEVAWYDWSSAPGTGSNAVFAGHVTWSGQAVFYRLDTLARGDQVRLVGQDGGQLLYTVTESFPVDPNDPSALSVMAPTAEDVITIITCDGEFFYTGDPVFRGDYTNRRVVRAAYTSFTPPAAAQAIPGS